MKTRFFLPLSLAAALVATIPANAAPPAAKGGKPAPAAHTNAPPVEVPKSVFVIPNGPKEGCDPFYPQSMRPYENSRTTTEKQPTGVSVELKGISGAVGKRLALIEVETGVTRCNRTLAEAEDTEVPTSGGKLKIRCIKINDDSIVVDVGNDRREVRLRRGV